MSVYEQVRPLILDVMEVGVLCDVVHMIKMEIIAGDVIKRSNSLFILLIRFFHISHHSCDY